MTERELAINAITGITPPSVYDLGIELEAVIDERDAAVKEVEESGERITEMENGLIAALETLEYVMRLHNDSETVELPERGKIVTDAIAEIEKVLKGD